MAREELFKISVRAITYDGSSRIINCLTFVFENEFSPPLGTYDKDPTQIVELNQDKRIGTVEFGLHFSNYGMNYALCSIRFL